MPQKKAVHFGGGNIGRGFVAEFLHNSGYEVVFLDVIPDLINKLQSVNSYTVTEVGPKGEHTFEIKNYRAINSKENEAQAIDEIATAEIVTCAVGPNILKFIAPVIAKAIDKRTEEEPLAVIACENAIGATDTLAGFIKEKLETSESDLPKKARFANSAIDRIVPNQKPDAGLNVTIEEFSEWCVDKTPFKDTKNGHPKIDKVHFVDDLVPFIERKLFTVNTGHTTAAYYGHHFKKQYIHNAMEDQKIHDIVQEVLRETSNLIVNKHGITESDQKEYVKKIITRISNPLLEDVVERVGRAPLRKLTRKERFVAPASELAKEGKKVDGLLGVIEMALRFQNVEGDDESKELAKILKSHSAPEATEKLCGLKSGDDLYDRVVKIVEKVQKDS